MTGQRVVVVTGGALGIGAAISEELGRTGAFVVTMDPGVAVDGSAQAATTTAEPTTAERIVAAGGAARASNTSVTDEAAVRALFAGLVEEFGALDAVVNVAGITRLSGFAAGGEDDWAALLSVHLDGYLNVLRAALPIMAEAGHGRILGVTSGSGWRAANAGGYSGAKRAVASLTWQIGQAAPSGVTVNALSPIAATRMVTNALARQPSAGTQPGSTAVSGGVSLGSGVPLPETLGPVGAYLAGDEFSWCSGQVIFSNGSEVAWVAPPRLLEVAPSADVTSLPHALETLMPGVFTTAEAAQGTNGGSNPRFGTVFDGPAADLGASDVVRRCVIVTDDAAWGADVGGALAARGVECVGVGAWQRAAPGSTEIASGFEAAAAQIVGIAADAGPIDAVVVALVGDGSATGVGAPAVGGWQQILDEHTGITDDIRTDAGWMRAASDYSEHTGRPVRVVTVTSATSAGGRSRAQAAAQLARSAHLATEDRVDAFAISVETSEPSARGTVADVVAHLVCGADTGALSGAELVAASGWFGLRSHPSPAGSITFGGPAIPAWLDGALRSLVTGASS